MEKKRDLAKWISRLCFWAVQVAELFGQSIKTGPETENRGSSSGNRYPRAWNLCR